MAATGALISQVLASPCITVGLRFMYMSWFGIQFRHLASDLRSIQALIIDADESRQLKDETIRLWLDRLKSAIYVIDDAVDEVEYYRLRLQVVKRKVTSFNLLSACFTSCVCVRFSVRHTHIGILFTNLNSRLFDFASEKDKYGAFLLRGGEERVQQRHETVNDIDIQETELPMEDMFGPLWSIYNDLPSSLRQCFLHCATFPKNCRLSKDRTVSLWMAHGFLKPIENRDMETVGHEYFEALATRSLFHDFEQSDRFIRLNKTYCKMDDTARAFAEFLMGKECLCLDMRSAEEVSVSVDATCNDRLYHLHVKLGEKVEFPDPFYGLRKLRSLVVSPLKNESLAGANLSKIFDRLTSLRSLSLSRCRLESVPPNVYKLIHLRWLNLSKNYVLKELPETICQLHHLQTLSVNWCASLIRFPKRVEQLVSLRNLKNDHTYFLLPKGIGKLSSLKKLSRVTIDTKFKTACCLRDLKNLNDIYGSLTIFFIQRERDTLVNDAKQAQLKEKKYITTLSLNLPERAEEEWMEREDEELVEALKAPSSLEMLRITCYKGAKSPSWINKLTSLRTLRLWCWSNCEHLPALAKLPCLEYIEFNSFTRVQKVDAEFLRMDDFMGPLFPKLKSLHFIDMIEWEHWSDYDGDEEVMPNLTWLNIQNCPKLKTLPSFISRKDTLQKYIS